MSFVTHNLELLTRRAEHVEALKQHILSLAVRGLLVPQEAGDEPAGILLKRIRAEKARLMKEGKLKKSVELAPLGEDEMPFELPEGWEWSRLENISNYIQRGKSPKYIDHSEVPVISQKCIQWNGFEIHKANFLDPKELNKYSEERHLRTGDILWNSTGLGTLGRAIVYEERFNPSRIAVADSHVTIIRPFKELSPQYIFLWIACPFVQNIINDQSSGSTKQTELATSTVRNYPIPLPPLPEQHRIVEKVSSLFALIDRLSGQVRQAEEVRKRWRSSLLQRLGEAGTREDWAQLSAHFDVLIDSKEAVRELRQAILQLAVRGVLVEQDREEEPASELLKRIRGEKKRLGKKEEGLAPVRLEDISYEVPMGWEWCRLGEIFWTRSGVTKGKKYYSNLVEVPYLRVANVQRGYLNLTEVKTIHVSETDREKYQLLPGDLLMTEGGDFDKLGRCAIWNEEIFGAIHQNHIFCVRPMAEDLDSAFFQILLNSKVCREYFENSSKQTTNLASINMTVLRNTPICIPPPIMQRRIVAQVERLMGWCDGLEGAMEAREGVMGGMVNSVV